MTTQKRVENEIKILERDLAEVDQIANPKEYKEFQETIKDIEKEYARQEDEYWEEYFREDYS